MAIEESKKANSEVGVEAVGEVGCGMVDWVRFVGLEIWKFVFCEGLLLGGSGLERLVR